MIDGARELRAPLTVGFCTIFTAWAAVVGRLPARSEADTMTLRIVDLWSAAGTSAQLALLTVAALFLGSMILRLRAVKSVLRKSQSVRNRPDWEGFVGDVLDEARNYEEVSVTLPGFSDSSSIGNSFTWPSSAMSEHLRSEIRRRQAMEAEAELRHVFAIASLAPAAVIALRGGGAWYVLLLVPVVLSIDMVLVDRQAKLDIFSYRWQYARSRMQSIQDSIAELASGNLQGRVFLGPDITIDAKEASLRSELVHFNEIVRSLQDDQPRSLGKSEEELDVWASQFEHFEIPPKRFKIIGTSGSRFFGPPEDPE